MSFIHSFVHSFIHSSFLSLFFIHLYQERGQPTEQLNKPDALLTTYPFIKLIIICAIISGVRHCLFDFLFLFLFLIFYYCGILSFFPINVIISYLNIANYFHQTLISDCCLSKSNKIVWFFFSGNWRKSFPVTVSLVTVAWVFNPLKITSIIWTNLQDKFKPIEYIFLSLSYIHNWSLQAFTQNYDLASHILYVVPTNFIHDWWHL